jgi:soluble lytic murein transglycosylase
MRKLVWTALVLMGLWVAFTQGRRYWREHRYDKVIVAAARRYQIDPGLIKAVVWRESAFNAKARGLAGELGLMQVRSVAAGEWAQAERLTAFQHSDCLNPATNIYAGAWYLKRVMKRYARCDNPVPYALADYNAGRANLIKWNYGPAQTNSAAFIAQIGFPSTRAYVQNILARSERYHRELAKVK